MGKRVVSESTAIEKVEQEDSDVQKVQAVRIKPPQRVVLCARVWESQLSYTVCGAESMHTVHEYEYPLHRGELLFSRLGVTTGRFMSKGHLPNKCGTLSPATESKITS